jgi:hypothetical protein
VRQASANTSQRIGDQRRESKACPPLTIFFGMAAAAGSKEASPRASHSPKVSGDRLPINSANPSAKASAAYGSTAARVRAFVEQGAAAGRPSSTIIIIYWSK